MTRLCTRCTEQIRPLASEATQEKEGNSCICPFEWETTQHHNNSARNVSGHHDPGVQLPGKQKWVCHECRAAASKANWNERVKRALSEQDEEDGEWYICEGTICPGCRGHFGFFQARSEENGDGMRD